MSPVTGPLRTSPMILKGRLTLRLMIVAFVYTLAGCQSPEIKPIRVGGGKDSIRNNCYGLLYQLLNEQKDVSLLRFIKREHPDVKELVKRIASTSGAGAKLLSEFAKQDRSIDLNDLRLPPGEVATRDAIGKTRKKELLGQSGDRFELSLLLTQIEALSYAGHLAKIASQNEPQPDRAQGVARMSVELLSLYEEVFKLLLSKEKLSAAKL